MLGGIPPPLPLENPGVEPVEYTLEVTAVVALGVAAVTACCAGAVVTRLLRVGSSTDLIARLGLWMATGLCVVPLLLEFSPIAFTPLVVRLVCAALIAGSLATTRWSRLLRSAKRRPVQWYAVAIVLLALVAGLAIAQMGGAAVAPGVDSVHHLMLARLIVAHGGVPPDLEPFIAGGRLAYHWGAHANVAFVALLLGSKDPFSVSALMVAYAALLRIICCLTLYAAARSLFADRTAGVIAAAVAAGFSALPAALVTQGRFTQLAGVAVLPALIALRPVGLRDANRSVLSAIVVAGMFLLQARLAIFGVAWIVAVGLFAARRWRVALVNAGITLSLSALLVLPWGVRLAREPLARSMVRGDAFAQSENRWTQRHIPAQLAWLPNNGLLLSAATAGLSGVAGLGASGGERLFSAVWLCLTIVAVAEGERRRKERKGRSARRQAARAGSDRRNGGRVVAWRPFALVAVWIALSVAALLARSPAVDATNVVPYAAAVLTAFIPMILMASGIASAAARALLPAYRTLFALVIIAASVLTGVEARGRTVVHSPVPEADAQAMHWIRANVPLNARFAVMARPFFGIYVGEDAGYFIQVLTDRRSLLPPMIYGWVSPVAQVAKTNELLRLWTTVHPDASVPKLAAAGVTHAYIGSTAQPQTRDIMRNCSQFKLIYDRNDVLIAEMKR